MTAMCFVGEEALFQFSINTKPFAATRSQGGQNVFSLFQLLLPILTLIHNGILELFSMFG